MEMETKDTQRGDLALVQTLAHEAGPTAVDARPPATGAARFERGREIGRGGMGRVVEAIDRQFNRTVAVKEIIGDAPTGAAVRRFTTEALVTGNLEHPGIPSVYERGVDANGRPFYAMRRVQGRTLARLLADADTRDKRLALLPVVTRAAHTIGFAHDRGVVHRDIKPDNILVGDHGETFVLDWGLARVRGVPVEDAGPSAPSGEHATQYGAVVGTPAYMAPEQAAGDLDRIDERTDVFALGALLYHVITGAAPYRADSIDGLVAAAKHAKIAPIVQQGIPRDLVAICTKATAREPGERYRNARELAVALDDFGAHAVLGRPSRAVNRTFDLIMVVMIPLAIYGVLSAISMSAPLSVRNSVHALSVFVLSACGMAASLVDWRTRGRYRLSTLSFGFVFATFFVGIGGAALGLSQQLGGLRSFAGSTDELRNVIIQGTYESVGELAIAPMLSALQLALWAIARRVAERAGDRRGAIV